MGEMTTAPVASLANEAAAHFREYREGKTGRMVDLVALLTRPLWSVARSAGLDPERAEDVVQGAWEALVRRADAIEDPQTVFAWLLTTTRRAAWRAAAQRTETELPEEVVATAPSPEAAVVEGDLGQRLWQHVAHLNPRCQALLRVIAFAPRPDYAAISEALGMPVGSIGPTRGRCLAALRTALAADPTWSLT